jgi:transcriptional regulator with XRE-family HTH domain
MFIDRPGRFNATDDTLGGRISLARDACNLSVEAAARTAGISPDTWAAFENDRDIPLADHLPLIADALDVSLAWVVSGHGTGPVWIANDNVAAFR